MRTVSLRRCYLIAGALLLTTHSANADMIDWYEWKVADGGNGHFYGITQETMSWQEGENLAVLHGGHLASVSSAAENEFIFSTSGLSVWIGLNDLASEGNFVWTSGEAVTYTNWRAGEPNGGTNENVTIIRHEEGQWNDSHDPFFHAAIELNISPVPEPASLMLCSLAAAGFFFRIARRRSSSNVALDNETPDGTVDMH
jgi:hypothetical protein